jgi:hypothetical protein
MKRAPVLICVAAFLASTLIGCTERIGDFTLASTKNVDIGGKYKKLQGRFTGEDVRGMLLTIPLGQPSFKKAVDNCIEAGKGDLITDVVLDHTFWTAIVWGQQGFTVTGDVWVKAPTSELIQPGAEIFELQADSKGFQLVSLSDPLRTINVEYMASR